MSRFKRYGVEPDFYKDLKYEENTEESLAEIETNGPGTINGTVINSLVVNMRKEPSLESETLGVLTRGDKVEVFDKLIDGFYKIFSINENQILGEAFILSDFIKEG